LEDEIAESTSKRQRRRLNIRGILVQVLAVALILSLCLLVSSFELYKLRKKIEASKQRAFDQKQANK
jgi:cytochrome c-type biogenesis protein CcmE